MSSPDVILSLSAAGLASDLYAAPAAPPSTSRIMHFDDTTNLRAMPSADANTSALMDLHFVPTSLAVAARTTASWQTLGGEPHTVVRNDGLFRSDGLDQNDFFAFNLDTPGACKSLCSIHPQMMGTISHRIN
jgi:plastocyanin